MKTVITDLSMWGSNKIATKRVESLTFRIERIEEGPYGDSECESSHEE